MPLWQWPQIQAVLWGLSHGSFSPFPDFMDNFGRLYCLLATRGDGTQGGGNITSRKR